MSEPAAVDSAWVEVERWLAGHEQGLVRVRRDLHRHPELGWSEHRTTALVADALRHVGLAPRLLSRGTGLLCDIGPLPAVVGLRADLDALPVPDACGREWGSEVTGASHACGHDLHTTVVLGAGLALARLASAGRLAHGVRLLFQPAEEVMPGGALTVIEEGGLAGLRHLYGVHCDPTVTAGQVGLKVGPLTAASDGVTVALSGPGGHTARPHLTADLVSALGAVAAHTPALLSRRLDPRAGTTLVWGRIEAGTAHNVIPRHGLLEGTVRVLDRETWHELPKVLEEVVRTAASPYGVDVEVTHTPGVPPVVNDAAAVEVLRTSAERVLGAGSVVPTLQSLGGEDFGWYLEQVPGAMARLGVGPADGHATDLHQPGFDVDEQAIAAGVRLLAAAALAPQEG